MSGDGEFLEYDDDMTAVLEAVWGEGFMSPGGPAEVDRIVASLDLTGKKVLDIGAGLGGVSAHLATLGPEEIVGIDVEAELKPKAEALFERKGVAGICCFRIVEPGPLPFEDNSFDVVFSKDSIIHIADKAALALEVFRVLRPGGWFAASDWLAGYDDEPTPEMVEYIEAEGLDFGLANADAYATALAAAGFDNIVIEDRNAWYREEARRERDRIATELYDELSATVEREFLDRETGVWDKMIVALDQGQLRPTHMRGRKPD